ncbi:MAG: SpoIIE family protein phosphatase, partial [Desulfamplus sp.]|nr:SpoIIE family protein phosphatase [Desulfamplus sp.]
RLIKESAAAEGYFVPVIILTTLNEPEDMAQAIKCGADDFMSKPAHSLVLKNKIVAMERLRQLYHDQNTQNMKLKAAIEEVENSRLRLEQYSGVLKDANIKLELMNNKMRQEHDAASNLFQKVIQTNEQKCTNVKSIISSMENFCGDLVLSRSKPSGGLYLMLGDFAGHGLLAAIGALPVSEIFNSMADENEPICRFVYEINRRLKELLPPAVFLCASILEMDFNEKEMAVWNGGIPDIIIVGKQGGIKQKVKSRHLPLGILTNERVICDIETCYFDHEDHVYLFSDGVTETFNEKDEMYGQERLESHFEPYGTNTDDDYDKRYEPATILDEIRNSIDSFRGNISQRDDITMVQISCSAEQSCS